MAYGYWLPDAVNTYSNAKPSKTDLQAFWTCSSTFKLFFIPEIRQEQMFTKHGKLYIIGSV
jgi:hypothetical protein